MVMHSVTNLMNDMKSLQIKIRPLKALRASSERQ